MKVELKQPDPSYPLVNVFAHTDYRSPKGTEQIANDLHAFLSKNRITLLCPWSIHEVQGTTVIITAVALLEDEHRKPAKRTKK